MGIDMEGFDDDLPESAADLRGSTEMSRNLDEILPPGGALAGRLFARILGEHHDDPPLAPGTRIGGWRIGALLGCGGSSMVYLAHRDDGHFEQQAALKIVRPNPALVEQFRRERQILAGLRHPSIARLIDGGAFDGGRLWFAMEPVFGQRIDQHVRSRRLPLAGRLQLFEAVCDAVTYAHGRQLIHRDIKPGNVLIDDGGQPRLLDFGIASGDDEDESGGHRAMTPIYASPEQRAGGSVGAASDIYQLGVLLGVLLLNPDGSTCAALPHRPRAVVRREVAAVIARATATSPANRYPSAAALRADVAAIRWRRPVSVVGGTAYRAARFIERHAVSSAIACSSIIALTATAGVAAYQIGIARDHAREAATHVRTRFDSGPERVPSPTPSCAVPEKKRPPDRGGLCER
ncbi:MAG TPA: serine/threonine-protein kinase [Rhodanobacteraceae bacterium]|nr:serine/threonine-protein kinase [Rhodanobacteraceae bacterium]